MSRPGGWATATPDPAVPDALRPGDGLAMVSGHGLDVVDVDTKNGADLEVERQRLQALGVVILGESRTPGGGGHFYVLSTGLGTSANPSHGVDFRGGHAAGTSRGLAYMPGTTRPKYDGGEYEWVTLPDLDLIGELDRDEQRDALTSYLLAVGITPTTVQDAGPSAVAGEPVDLDTLPAWLAEEIADLGSWTDRSERFHYLVAECARAGYTQGQAVTLLGPWCDATGKYPGRVAAEVARCWGKVDGDNLRDKAERDARLGEQLAATIDRATPATVADPAAPEPARVSVADELAADRHLQARVGDLLRDRRAREIVADLERARNPQPAPDAGTLADILNRPQEPPHRIEGVLPSRGRMLWTASRKTGKSTAVGNAARCLITGEDFLGRFGVRPIDGRVTILNYEVTGQQAAGWYRDMGVPGDRLYLVNLRGARNLLADDAGRAELVDLLRAVETEVLVVDPFSRAYTGKSQNDVGEVAPWLGRLDQVAEAAGVAELILTAHAGWDQERTRGSSGLEDWADSIVWMTRDPETNQRFLRAEGRDVDVEEDALDYDPRTRRLTLTGSGNRKQVREVVHLDRLVESVVSVVAQAPGINVAGLRDALRERDEHLQREDANRAARVAVERGLVRREKGARGAWLHYPASSSDHSQSGVPTSPEQSRGPVVSSPDPSYRDGTTYSTGNRSSSPEPPTCAEPDQAPPTHACAGPDCRTHGCAS